MATWEDVRRIALALPQTRERFMHGTTGWAVKDKGFVWERPLRKSDLAALGSAAPKGAILGVRTADLEMKEVLLARDPDVYFTTPHFDGYPAVLVRLGRIKVGELKDIVLEAWLARAPQRIAEEYLAACTPAAGSGKVRRRKRP
ncbi:MAG TPA: MmcQ/YjbR family DNA-binding protein [Candidatus Acidoferrum sp.]|nr:MmcQ/YjbR family DNA-binding protein [Candidatus Acidoferrum sp.]